MVKETHRVETFESLEEANPLVPPSTSEAVRIWRGDPRPLPAIPTEILLDRRAALQEHLETVNDLRRWFRSGRSGTAVTALRRIFSRDVKVRKPAEDRLYRTINYFFPPRSDIKITVCDFGPGRAERKQVRLGDIEADFRSKPAWSTVRWIHAPLGPCFLNSSLIDLFFETRTGEMGPAFPNAGEPVLHHLECLAVNIRNRHWVAAALDLVHMMRAESKINDVLDRGVFAGMNHQTVKDHLRRNAQHAGRTPNFWDLAKADLSLSWQHEDSEGSHPAGNTPQALSLYSFFKNASIGRCLFRGFRRDDGFLLTTSAPAGVAYLNLNLSHYLEAPAADLAEDSFASVTAEIFEEFSTTGTDKWHRKNMEWFLVYLMTEMAATPHNIRQERSVPDLVAAYTLIVMELKKRRYDQWRRNETIALVRSYLICLDDLKLLEEICTQKLDWLQRLRKDCNEMPGLQGAGFADNPPDNPEGESALDRVAFVEQEIRNAKKVYKELIADLKESLNTLFQLRSIEQNELAITADSQNKAIFVFTSVTIVFLPLSFFTSYFGMNLKGVADTDHDEAYFWRVCGSVSFAIIMLVVLWAFKPRIVRGLSPGDQMVRR